MAFAVTRHITGLAIPSAAVNSIRTSFSSYIASYATSKLLLSLLLGLLMSHNVRAMGISKRICMFCMLLLLCVSFVSGSSDRSDCESSECNPSKSQLPLAFLAGPCNSVFILRLLGQQVMKRTGPATAAASADRIEGLKEAVKGNKVGHSGVWRAVRKGCFRNRHRCCCRRETEGRQPLTGGDRQKPMPSLFRRPNGRACSVPD